jgi:hypothetical protein
MYGMIVSFILISNLHFVDLRLLVVRSWLSKVLCYLFDLVDLLAALSGAYPALILSMNFNILLNQLERF